jgi:hypothetical protein
MLVLLVVVNLILQLNSVVCICMLNILVNRGDNKIVNRARAIVMMGVIYRTREYLGCVTTTYS